MSGEWRWRLFLGALLLVWAGLAVTFTVLGAAGEFFGGAAGAAVVVAVVAFGSHRAR